MTGNRPQFTKNKDKTCRWGVIQKVVHLLCYLGRPTNKRYLNSPQTKVHNKIYVKPYTCRLVLSSIATTAMLLTNISVFKIMCLICTQLPTYRYHDQSIYQCIMPNNRLYFCNHYRVIRWTVKNTSHQGRHYRGEPVTMTCVVLCATMKCATLKWLPCMCFVSSKQWRRSDDTGCHHGDHSCAIF